MDGIVEGEGSNGGGEGSPVEDTEVLLGAEGDGFDAVGCEGLVGGDDSASTERCGTVEDADARVAGEGACDVGQRGEICDRD